MVTLLDHPHFAELAAGAAVLLSAAAEWLHRRRVARLGRLVLGPSGRPGWLLAAAPWLTPLALGALVFGLSTLLLLPPKRYAQGSSDADDPARVRHALVLLDVSPSMRLVDAGPEGDRSRMAQARAIVESFFLRVPLERYRVTVVAFYTGAKTVVSETKDFEVVRNILGDLPMHYAFRAGKTDLFAGLKEAAAVAAPWNPQTATLLVLTDGDTVPATGMPRLPASIGSTIVVGVGDPRSGSFIDGRQSRQESATLKQVAARLGGHFHDGNQRHLSTRLIADSTGLGTETALDRLTRREYALAAALFGSLWLALLPLLLQLRGARGWPRPAAGVAPARSADSRAPTPSTRRWTRIGASASSTPPTRRFFP